MKRTNSLPMIIISIFSIIVAISTLSFIVYNCFAYKVVFCSFTHIKYHWCNEKVSMEKECVFGIETSVDLCNATRILEIKQTIDVRTNDFSIDMFKGTRCYYVNAVPCLFDIYTGNQLFLYKISPCFFLVMAIICLILSLRCNCKSVQVETLKM